MTRVPNASAHSPGLINVRGNVMPLLDLRTRLGMAPAEDCETTQIIVPRIKRHEDALMAGLRTDAVFEVVDIGSQTIRLAPPHSTCWHAALMPGVIRRNDHDVIILNLGEVEGCRTNGPD